eukprot:923852-Pyramimonas_sp.AAC.1
MLRNRSTLKEQKSAVAVTALASMLFVFVFNYAQHGSRSEVTEALDNDRMLLGKARPQASFVRPITELLKPHTTQEEQHSTKMQDDLVETGVTTQMGESTHGGQTAEMSLYEGNVTMTVDGEESDSDELPEELRDNPLLPSEERKERQQRRQEYFKERALRISRESIEKGAQLTYVMTMIELLPRLQWQCRSRREHIAYGTARITQQRHDWLQVKWPNKGPPMRELGFPIQASESKNKILTKEEFIRNKQMPLPKELPIALVPHPNKGSDQVWTTVGSHEAHNCWWQAAFGAANT